MAGKKEEKAKMEEQAKTVKMSFPSTYSVITAARILDKFDIKLPQHRVKNQVFHPDTFYHKLMFLPARQINTAISYEQCRDFQAYAQQKLIHYLFSGETAKSDKKPGADFRDSIEKQRVHLVEMGKDLEGWHEKHTSFIETSQSTLEEKVKAWHETVQQVASEASDLLAAQSVTIEKGFSEALFPLLLDHAAGIRVPSALSEALKLKDPIGIVEKAVVCLLAKDKDNTPLTKSIMKALKTPFSALDQKLKLIIDDVGGVNAQEGAGIEASDAEIEKFTKAFSEQAGKISRNLHEYYQRYGESNLKVDTDQKAFEQGVDKYVAEDYDSLRAGRQR
jgi:gas vesicle protein